MSSRGWSKKLAQDRAKFLGLKVPQRMTKKARNKINRQFRETIYREEKQTLTQIRKFGRYTHAPASTLAVSLPARENIQYRYLGDIEITVGGPARTDGKPRAILMKSTVTISGTYEGTREQALAAWHKSIERIAKKQSVVEIKLIGELEEYEVHRTISTAEETFRENLAVFIDSQKPVG